MQQSYPSGPGVEAVTGSWMSHLNRRERAINETVEPQRGPVGGTNGPTPIVPNFAPRAEYGAQRVYKYRTHTALPQPTREDSKVAHLGFQTAPPSVVRHSCGRRKKKGAYQETPERQPAGISPAEQVL